jgi:hypothetical protein
MPTDLIAAGLALLGGLAAIAIAMWRQRTKGREEGRDTAQTEALKDAAKRTEQGRQAVQRGRASGGDPADRLRRNDGQW